MYQNRGLFNSMVSLDKDSRKPVYLQIAEGITHSIRSGKLRRGQQLPGARSLANDLDVHRKTLQTALDELTAQGWLEIIPRRGTFVARDFPEPKLVRFLAQQTEYPERTNFTVRKTPTAFPLADFQFNDKIILTEGFPDIRIAPIQQLVRELRSMAGRGTTRKYFHYGNPQGTMYLRETLSTFISETRGIMTSPEQIMITKGAQMGIYLAAQVLIKPGDEVIVGDPGYVTGTLTFQRAGAVINKVRVDENGINVDDVEALCAKRKIRMIYVISHHHHPTTVTLTLERRVRLLNLAARYKFAIVEDDYDYDFHYSSGPMVPMASFDQYGNVIYIGTLTKTFVPSVRIGFMIAPGNFMEEAIKVRRSMDFQGDSFLEVAMAELYKSGVIGSHIKKAVRIYKDRRDHFCHLLQNKLSDHVSFTIPDGGLGVWTKFHRADLPRVCQLALRKGLSLTDGSIYNTGHSYNCTRLGFSSLNFSEQEKAIGILHQCVDEISRS